MAFNALFIGSTALQANGTMLDVVGQNLANLNTTGFKTQRTMFSDLVYQTYSVGSGPSAGLGGTNPVQSGSGVGVGAVGSLFTQGSISPTGRVLDAAIQGRGFFVVSNGNSTAYTRAGSFDVDAAGFLVDPATGFRVQRTGNVGEATATTPGFQVAGNSNIQVPLGAGLAGTPTANATMQGNLDSAMNIGDTFVAPIQIFDSQGSPLALTVTFTKTATNTFSATATISNGTATIPATPITFDTNGFLVSPATLPVAISGIPGVAAQTVNLNLGTPGQSTGLTQFGGSSTATAVTQDGVGFGTLQSVSFDQSGQVIGQFSNGRTVPIAQLAIATFNNEGGLVRDGLNYFTPGPGSGQPLIGAGNSGGRGSIQGGALEGSNVDIATEFALLIIAQRGFQVNARTITAASDTLQELANIIR